MNVGTCPVDFAVDETLQIYLTIPLVDGVCIEIEFHDVIGRDKRRGKAARHQKSTFIFVVSYAYVSKTVHDTLLVENSVRDNEILNESRIGFARSKGRHLLRLLW